MVRQPRSKTSHCAIEHVLCRRGASVVLQGDVDEVMNMVRRLHGRLSDAACWTRNLQEDTEASREKVSSLISQVHICILLYVYARCVGLCLERWVIYAKIPSGDRERCIGSLGIRRAWVVLPTEVEARALVFVVYESSWTLLHPQ